MRIINGNSFLRFGTQSSQKLGNVLTLGPSADPRQEYCVPFTEAPTKKKAMGKDKSNKTQNKCPSGCNLNTDNRDS